MENKLFSKLLTFSEDSRNMYEISLECKLSKPGLISSYKLVVTTKFE